MSEVKKVEPVEAATTEQARPQFGKIKLDIWNSVLPLDKLSTTPSQQDGLSEDLEVQIRSLGCELVQLAGKLLRLPQVAMATGCVLFQRFYYAKSFMRLPFDIVAMACLTLASKIEEAPRRIRDIINVFHHIKQVRSGRPIQPVLLDHNYINLKNQVIKAERRVLKELGFCVHVKHPHKIIVMYLRWLEHSDHRELLQMSWNFMNDSLRTDVFVRYSPETIAVACIYLAARKLKVPLPKNPSWFDVLGVEEDDIKDCCYRMICLYNRKKPNQEELEGIVDNLRRKIDESRKAAREQVSANHTPYQSSPVSRNNSPSTLAPSGAAGGAFATSASTATSVAPPISSYSAPPSVAPVTANTGASNENGKHHSEKHGDHHKSPRKKSKKHKRSRSRSFEDRYGHRRSKDLMSPSEDPSVISRKHGKRSRKDKHHSHHSRSRSRDRDYYHSSSTGVRGGVCGINDLAGSGTGGTKYRYGSNGYDRSSDKNFREYRR